MIKTIKVNNFIKGKILSREFEVEFLPESKNNAHLVNIGTDDKQLMYFLNKYEPIKKQL